MKTILPKPVKKRDGWWIPRCPPHYMQSHGPYATRIEAEDDRQGMQELINTPKWRSFMTDLDESENDED